MNQKVENKKSETSFNETHYKIKNLVAKHYSIKNENISDDILLSELGFDYLNRTEITINLEEHFDIEICDDKIEACLKFNELVEYVDSLINS